MKKFGNTSFEYDANGLRTKKGNKEYVWSGDRLLYEKEDGEITTRYFYDASGIAGYNYRGGEFKFRKNLQGDIIGIVDNTGTLLGTYEYDAWGNCTATKVIISGTSMVLSMNPFRYRGYYFDSETGLYYLQSRYYDPKTGRFISPDAYSYLEPDTVNGLNLYSYCNNNPVMNVDPSGHIVWSLFFLVVGVSFSIGVGASVVNQAVQYGVNSINYGQAVVDGLFTVASTALAFTGIGLSASMALNGFLGYMQYAIDIDFHEGASQTIEGALFAIGTGIFAGLRNGVGANNLQSLSKTLYKASTTISTQLIKHMIDTGAKVTTNLISNAFIGSANKIMERTILRPLWSWIFKFFSKWLGNNI